MLIVYDKQSKAVVSISGIRGKATEEEINKIQVIDLPENQAEYRIYNQETIDQVWKALDDGDGIELVFEGEIPVGIQVIDMLDPEP